MSPEEMNDYIKNEENGLSSNRIRGAYRLEVSYRPIDLVWMDEFKTAGRETRDSLKKSLANRYYFLATYSTPQNSDMDPLSRLSSNRELYKQILSRISFRFKDFVKIKLSNEEFIEADGCNFSKSYGMIPNNQVLFYFEDERLKHEKEITLYVEDIGFEIGLTKSTFLQENIKNIPKLLYST